VPERVSVEGGSVEIGTAMTTLRTQAQLSSFAVSKLPTTVAQYGQCVSAGVCSAPDVKLGTCGTMQGIDGATYSHDPAADALPVTCTSVEQAKQYCDWVGGHLAKLGEWLLAARGQTTRRFAWGSDGPTCDRIARRAFLVTDSTACCDNSCDTHVGTHPSGASPSGMQDVLLTRGELVLAQDDSPFASCGTSHNACAVVGLVPGGIDHVIGAPVSEAALSISRNVAALGFRCAWEGGVK
jgi:formylglycine-generating enzyme required for sulfatase activity